MRISSIGVSCLLVLGSLLSAQAERPNVVLMLADDLGYGDLSCYGSPETQTPNLDKLASQGMRFTDFYAACAVCSPSRGATMTGRFSVRAGIYSWIHTSHEMHLRTEETTIAELVKTEGYSTAHIGKWHLGYDLEEGSGDKPNPGDHGFDHWMATGNNAIPSHRDPNNFVLNGKALGEVPGYSCQIVADQAIEWLNEKRDKDAPFFLNVWFHEPHAKVAAPPELAARHKGKKNPQYYGCIENMDIAVGRLMKTLEEMGADDNTLVIFTSDNGSYMAGSNGNLKGRKTQLWEGGIREPGIIRWPGHIKPGQVTDTPAGLVDLLPTICKATGAKLPTDRILDGVPLQPLFTGEKLVREKPLYWFYNPSRPVCVIRDGDYCLIADPEIDLPKQNMFKEEFIGDIKKTGLLNFRLYHLRNDTGQEHDLASQQPDRLEKMKQQMLDLHREVVAEAYDWREDLKNQE
jgi:arylsulfatase A